MTPNQTSKLARFAVKIGEFGEKARIRPVSSVTSLCVVSCFAATLSGYCIERSDSMVRANVTQWMKGHPVMGTQARSIKKVEVYPSRATPGAVAVVSLSPQGTVVINRDTRLPMVVMYTPDDTIRDLKDYVDPAKHAAAMLASLGANQSYAKETSTVLNDTYVPAMLATDWGQWPPFNMNFPQNPQHNNERAVTGCGTIAVAQILNYYQWPPYGEGSLTHTDTEGDFRPTLSSNFEHVFRWDLMKSYYKGDETGADAKAVAQLVYDTAVLGVINCEYNSSCIGIDHAGSNLANYLFYSKENTVNGNGPARQAMEQNLLKRIPVVAGIAYNQAEYGHAVVFDGLVSHKGETSYHLNYGWYKEYNLWWDKDAVRDVWHIQPGILPELVALPTDRTLRIKKGEAIVLPWNIATQRQAEIAQLNLYQQTLKTGTWVEECEKLPAKTDTRSWSLDRNGRTGSCWKANSPYPFDYLTIVDEFIPTAATTIQFEERHTCIDNYVQIEASVEGGEFQSLCRIDRIDRTSDNVKPWVKKTINLGKFSGQKLKLRIGYYMQSGYYFSNEQGGGIWIDNLQINNTAINAWDLIDTTSNSKLQKSGQDVASTHPQLESLPIGTYTFSASLTDKGGVEKQTGSKFTLEIHDGPIDPPVVVASEKLDVTYRNAPQTNGATIRIPASKKVRQTVKLVIQNNGSKPMESLKMSLKGSNSFTASLGRNRLAPGESTVINIYFRSKKAKPQTASIRLSSSAGSKIQIKVVGK